MQGNSIYQYMKCTLIHYLIFHMLSIWYYIINRIFYFNQHNMKHHMQEHIYFILIEMDYYIQHILYHFNMIYIQVCMLYIPIHQQNIHQDNLIYKYQIKNINLINIQYIIILICILYKLLDIISKLKLKHYKFNNNHHYILINNIYDHNMECQVNIQNNKMHFKSIMYKQDDIFNIFHYLQQVNSMNHHINLSIIHPNIEILKNIYHILKFNYLVYIIYNQLDIISIYNLIHFNNIHLHNFLHISNLSYKYIMILNNYNNLNKLLNL